MKQLSIEETGVVAGGDIGAAIMDGVVVWTAYRVASPSQ